MIINQFSEYMIYNYIPKNILNFIKSGLIVLDRLR